MTATALVAGLVTISLLWLVQSVGTPDLPVMTSADLAKADFSMAGFREYSYEGEIVGLDGHSDNVSLVPTAGQGLGLRLRLAHSEGPSLLAGSLAAETGAFGAGPRYDRDAPGGSYRVDGLIRGPALVDGVPTVYLEATVRPVFPQSPSYEGPVIRRWSGLLRATGRTHL